MEKSDKRSLTPAKAQTISTAAASLDLYLLAKLTIKPGKLVIYADQCLLGEEFMRRHAIIFKKIPHDITHFLKLIPISEAKQWITIR
ncbi:MAG: hypothetical protein WCI11_18550 [Candidatus Methylumidiphilus sp.]